MDKTLYLIDGTALLYRAYYAHIRSPLINSKGMNTSAIFGVVSSFIYFVENFKPEHVVIAFDRKGPTFRHEKSELYKANRPPMPEDMIPQVEPVMKFFEIITVPELGRSGWEADDILGSLAYRFKNDYQVIIVTGDKDYCQLVQERIRLYDPMKKKLIDTEEVINKYGIEPSQFIDYLALMGDSSDNIPGVKGIGPVGAQKLLSEFGSLDGIYANLESIAPKIREKLEDDRDNAYLSQELARIAADMELDFPDPAQISFKAEYLARAKDFLAEYELNTLKGRLEQKFPQVDLFIEEESYAQADIFGEPEEAVPSPLKTAESFVAKLATSDKLPELLEVLRSASVISLDTETDSVDSNLANLVGISLCVSEDEAWYIPLAHQMADNLSWEVVRELLAAELKGKTILGHNLKYDLAVLQRAGLILDNVIFDTMLAAYILEPGQNRYSLDAVMQAELNYSMQPISELIGKGKQEITFDLVDPNAACFYAAEDAWAVWRLHPIFAKRLDQTGLEDLYLKIELPLLRVLLGMEQRGVFIDTRILGKISIHLQHEIKRLSDEIYGFAGYQFNLNSTQQLAKLLFEEQGIPAKKKTKTGYSTDNSVLEELAEEHEIAAKLIEYRQMVKLDSTYVSALPKLINPETGRVHSSFNQTVASTGRLSSTNPNLQNIPIRTALGREIRTAFAAASEDWVIVSADYSQIELRLLALMSQDALLLEAFAKGIDIHRQTAAKISRKAVEEVSSEERRRAKVINFGLLYGMGQRKLSRELGISQVEAKQMIEEYFAQFPSIREYISSSVLQARRFQYAETIFGRRLYLPQINSVNPGLRAEAERVAVNMPIQGSAADLIKLAMIDIDRILKDRDDIRMILQVHDELVFEVKKDTLTEAKSLIVSSMEGVLPAKFKTQMRLAAEIGSGVNWDEAH